MPNEKALIVSARQPQAKHNLLSKWLPTIATGILLVICAWAPMAAAQDDPSKCFQNMLVNHYDFSQRDSLLLSALAIVDEKTWKDAGTNESLEGAYGLISGKGTYQEWDKERREFFSYNKLDINQYKEILLHSTWIGDRGYGVIEKCLDNMFGDRDGFHYTVRFASPELVTIQFHWSDPRTQVNFAKIIDSKIVNGNVDGEVKHKLSSNPIKVGKASVPIFVKREVASDAIFITLTTDLDRQPDVIRIDPLPPEKTIVFRQFVRETDPTGNAVTHADSKEIAAAQWVLTLKPSEGYEFAEKPSCTIDPHYPLSFVNILSQDWDQATNTFTCTGTQGANPRFIIRSWTQGKYEERCIMHCDAQKPAKTEAKTSSK